MFARSVDQAIVVFSQHVCIGLELALHGIGWLWFCFLDCLCYTSYFHLRNILCYMEWKWDLSSDSLTPLAGCLMDVVTGWRCAVMGEQLPGSALVSAQPSDINRRQEVDVPSGIMRKEMTEGASGRRKKWLGDTSGAKPQAARVVARSDCPEGAEGGEAPVEPQIPAILCGQWEIPNSNCTKFQPLHSFLSVENNLALGKEKCTDLF